MSISRRSKNWSRPKLAAPVTWRLNCPQKAKSRELIFGDAERVFDWDKIVKDSADVVWWKNRQEAAISTSAMDMADGGDSDNDPNESSDVLIRVDPSFETDKPLFHMNSSGSVRNDLGLKA